MAFDKYRSHGPSPFELYYDAFLHNDGRRYRLVLLSGEQETGVPTVGSFVDPRNMENTRFQFRADDGTEYQIPFSDLKEATLVNG